MNNKKNLNGKNQTKSNYDHSSITEFKLENKNKEIFNFLNNNQISSKRKRNDIDSILHKNKEKHLKENDLLNISNKEKNRTIRQNTEKVKDDYLFGNYVKNQKPFKCGKVYCFCYIEKYALFTIGPQYYYAIILYLFNNILFVCFINYFFQHIFQSKDNDDHKIHSIYCIYHNE